MAIDRWAMLSRWQRWIGEIRSLNKGDRVVSRVTVYLREMNPLKITFCITSSFLSMPAVSSCPLFTQTHCRDVLVYIIDLWCWGLVILASTVWMSISIHLHCMASNKWRRNSICQHSFKNYFVLWSCWHLPSSKTNVVEPTDSLQADSECSPITARTDQSTATMVEVQTTDNKYVWF